MSDMHQHVITPEHGIFIAGTAAWLPRRVPVEEEVRLGHCDAASARSSEMLSVTVVEGDEVGAEMAVRAAREVLRGPGCQPERVGLLLHATAFEQGLEVWSSASYVQRRVLGDSRVPAFEIRQASNGGLAACYLASCHLAALPKAATALVTTADRWALPSGDRWAMDPGTVYGDGGTAIVLSRVAGFARLTSVSLVSGPQLEGLHRPGPPDGVARFDLSRPVDLGARKKNFLRELGITYTVDRIEQGQRQALDAVLDATATKLSDIDWFVLPHFIRKRLHSNYLRHLGVDIERTTWGWSRGVGHLGPGDQVASLDHLVRSGTVEPGQRCLLMSVGAGLNWSCAVVEIDQPW
jgi:3-oxoacyl-[acyl-carrier-protein] synthase III